MFANRSVLEIMALIFVFVVSFVLVATGGMIAILEIRDPTTDTEGAVDGLFSAIAVILGALLGLLAGRADTHSLSDRPDGDRR